MANVRDLCGQLLLPTDLPLPHGRHADRAGRRVPRGRRLRHQATAASTTPTSRASTSPLQPSSRRTSPRATGSVGDRRRRGGVGRAGERARADHQGRRGWPVRRVRGLLRRLARRSSAARSPSPTATGRRPRSATAARSRSSRSPGPEGSDQTTVKNATFGFAPEYRIGKAPGHVGRVRDRVRRASTARPRTSSSRARWPRARDGPRLARREAQPPWNPRPYVARRPCPG